ncbi:MAG: hypothetical protein AABZ06_14845 [Bdellovibrionota bacterium]
MSKVFTKKMISISLLFLIASQAFAEQQSDLDKADAALSAVQSSLQQLYSSGAISFKAPEDETAFVKAMMQLQTAATAVANAKKSDASSAKLDGVLEEARFVQKIVAAYLGNNEIFGYHLKRGQIAVRIDAAGVYEKLGRRLPFLSGAVGGHIRVNPGEQIVTQFNSLKTEFYGLLVEAAHLDSTDSRIKSLAKWGNDTKVIYPGETFGNEIITDNQLRDLGLSN